jgi:hypothetical protein
MSIKGRVLRKVLSEAQKLINKKKSKLRVQESVKGVHKEGLKLRVKGAKTEAKFKSKQKPKEVGGGREPVTLAGARYGIGATEHKLHSSKLAIALKHPKFQGYPHGRETWRGEMERMYGGIHMSQDPKAIKKSIQILTKKLKKKKVIKALRGTLVKKGTKLAYRLATKKYPHVFKKKKFSVAEYKAKKMRKTPELAPLGVTKIAANDLRKLAVAEAIKSRIRHLGNITIKHNKKAMPLVWGKASKWRHIEKFQKYNLPKTKAKLESLGKQFANLTKYQDTLKAKTATKHSEGGEVVIGKNVDRSLL